MAHQVIPKVIPSNYVRRSDGNIAFRFKLPSTDLALRSVRVVAGVPEFTFTASRHVPTIQEEDVATAFRLAHEKKRPEFFYRPFPLGHPLRGRCFKEYSPGWLRWTGVGKLLEEADWNMKCLHVGARSNEAKNKFWSWPFTSQLTGLTNYEDFLMDNLNLPVMMSCGGAKVQINKNEMFFPEEPKIVITDGERSQYSRYISELFPSIAYYDEHKFLKVQELIKLVLAVEWLYKEKGVRPDFEWMMYHTSKPGSTSITQSQNEQAERRKPPSDMIPQPPADCIQPTTDATAATWEAGKNKILDSKCGIKRLYGYVDRFYSEMHLFEEDGTPCPPQRSLKCNFQFTSPFGEMTFFQPIPISEKSQAAEEMKKLKERTLKSLAQSGSDKITQPVLPASVETTMDGVWEYEEGTKMKISRSLIPRPPLAAPAKNTQVITATVDDFDLLYEGIDPNMPIQGAHGLVIPYVESWKELVSELSELPPCVVKFPFHPMINPVAEGGITTSSIPVRTEPLRTRATVKQPTKYSGVYRGCGNSVTVQATDTKVQGKIQLVRQKSAKFDELSAFFREKWINKGRKPPIICEIYEIHNANLQQRFECFKVTLNGNNKSERCFHGTILACDITSTGDLCCNPECAICAISRNGMDLECVGRTNPENPRFGKGIYFAFHSSKSNDYSTANTRGLKAVLICDVLPGKCFKIYENGEHSGKRFAGPPTGHNSVVGELNSRTSLPELAVYNPNAVMPRFIVVYQNIGDASSGAATII